MAALVKFHDFAFQLAKETHQLDTDVHRLFLAPTGAGSPSADLDTVLLDITTIAPTNLTGGVFPTFATQATEAAGVTTFAGDAVVVTATGGAVPTFRFYGIYNDTSADPADPVICYWDHGSDVTLAQGETFTVTFGADATMGTILTIE